MAASPLALITDCEGATLSEQERSFFTDIQPFGFILFQRHCESPDQVKQLVDELRACVAHDAPVFIDQEGGRVARLKPPHWDAYPPAARFAQAWLQSPAQAVEACRLNAQALAAELIALGINANCAPLADIPIAGADEVIGDRAFGNTPEPVMALARAQAEGLMAAGVLPVLKHIPGHGRAMADSHLALPVVDAPLDTLEASDFVPFKALADLPFAMTAHIRYDAIDPDLPATLSAKVIAYIRQQLGFSGLLMSDDLSMKALQGDLTTLARQTLGAGCDLVLHCNGNFEERMAVAAGCTTMSSPRYSLYEQACSAISANRITDRKAIVAQRDALLAPLAA